MLPVPEKTVFLYGHVLRAFLMRRNKIIPARFSQENRITWK